MSTLRSLALVLFGALLFAPAPVWAQTLYLRITGTAALQLTATPPTEDLFESVAPGAPRTWRLATPLGAPLTVRAGSIPAALWLRFAGGGGASRTIRLDLGSDALGVFATGTATGNLAGQGTLLNFALSNAVDRSLAVGDTLYLVVTQTAPTGASTSTRVQTLGSGATPYSTITLGTTPPPAVAAVQAYDAAAPGGTAGGSFTPGAVAWLRATVVTAFVGTDPTAVTLEVRDPAGVVRLTGAAMTRVAGAGTTSQVYEYAYSLPAGAPVGTWTASVTATGAGGTGSASGGFTVVGVPAAVADYRFDEAAWSGTAGEVVDTVAGRSGSAVGGATTAAASPAVPGSPGTCRYGTFNGSTQYVQLPASVPRATGTTTITAWIRTTHNWSTQKDMRIWVDDDSANGYALSLGDGGARRLRMFLRRPSLVILDSAAVVQQNQWYFVAAVLDTSVTRTLRLYVYDASGALLDSPSVALSSFQPGTGRVAIGGELDGAPDGEGVARWRFAGNIDEVRLHHSALTSAQLALVRAATRPCGAAVTGFRITTANAGLYCLDHAVTVTPVDATGNAIGTYSGTVRLQTSTARGSWLLQAGAGTLLDATPDDGVATYAFPGGQASATFALRYRSGAPLVNVDALEGSTGIRDDDTEGPIAFAPSGFTVTSQPLAAPVTSVPPFTTAVTAGAAQPVYLTAYGQSPTDATCGVIAGYAGAKPLKFWLTRTDPATGTVAATVDATAIASSSAAATAQSVTFVGGQALVAFQYRDVGRVTLDARDDVTAGALLPAGIRGSTGAFVVRPADFVISNVRRTSDGAANPGATTAGGAVFLAAGRPFTATVTAVGADGSATPNFGRETAAESVRFTTALVLPTAGAAPAVAGAPGAFVGGQATGSAFSWPEVGILRLVPRIADGDYLGSGDVVGTPGAPVGRFVPDRFELALNTPVFQTACTAGGFTYVGQPFAYAVPPVLTASAVAAAGTATTNYTGALFRLTDASLGTAVYAAGAYALDTTGLAAAGANPAIVDRGGGLAELTYSAGSGLALARAAPVAPFTPAITLTAGVVDADGVAAAAPAVFGASGGIAFSTGGEQRYGRLTLRSAAGSERLDLPVRLAVQHWLDAARGFTTSIGDQCTVAPTITLRNWTRALSAGETCVRDAGIPGASGAGCVAVAPLSSRLRSVAVGGDFNLVLAAPGDGNSGSVTVEAATSPWLRYDWDAGTPGLENPAALATFGVYPGAPQRVYQREVY